MKSVNWKTGQEKLLNLNHREKTDWKIFKNDSILVTCRQKKSKRHVTRDHEGEKEGQGKTKKYLKK